MKFIANFQLLAIGQHHFFCLQCFLHLWLIFTSRLDDIHELSSIFDVRRIYQDVSFRSLNTFFVIFVAKTDIWKQLICLVAFAGLPALRKTSSGCIVIAHVHVIKPHVVLNRRHLCRFHKNVFESVGALLFCDLFQASHYYCGHHPEVKWLVVFLVHPLDE